MGGNTGGETGGAAAAVAARRCIGGFKRRRHPLLRPPQDTHSPRRAHSRFPVLVHSAIERTTWAGERGAGAQSPAENQQNQQGDVTGVRPAHATSAAVGGARPRVPRARTIVHWRCVWAGRGGGAGDGGGGQARAGCATAVGPKKRPHGKKGLGDVCVPTCHHVCRPCGPPTTAKRGESTHTHRGRARVGLHTRQPGYNCLHSAILTSVARQGSKKRRSKDQDGAFTTQHSINIAYPDH